VERPEQPIKVESDVGASIARALSILTLIAVLGLLGALGWLFVVYPDSRGPTGYVEEIVIEVPDGMTLRKLATRLKSEGVIENPRVWSLYMRMRGLDRNLRQGKIRFRVPMTPEEVARYATTRLGRIQIRLLIPEGFSRFEIAERLEEYGVCDAEEFLDATEDAAILASYGVEANDAEGYLFPDTYEFDDQTKPRRVVERMLANWTRRYEELEQKYASELAKRKGWTTHDIVTLASIVEKEAAVPAERPRIAGVFWNTFHVVGCRPIRPFNTAAWRFPRQRHLVWATTAELPGRCWMTAKTHTTPIGIPGCRPARSATRERPPWRRSSTPKSTTTSTSWRAVAGSITSARRCVSTTSQYGVTVNNDPAPAPEEPSVCGR
jgi:uncharacterized YceG family protein